MKIVLAFMIALIASCSVLVHLNGKKVDAQRKKHEAWRLSENKLYQAKIEKFCNFPTGDAPTMSGQIFNLEKYNNALKGTIYDIEKYIYNGSYNAGLLDKQENLPFREFRPNGVRYEVVNQKCYVADVVMPLTFNIASKKIAIGDKNWRRMSYSASSHVDGLEIFYAHICFRKKCEKPPVPENQAIEFAAIKKRIDTRKFFEVDGIPDVAFYALNQSGPHDKSKGSRTINYFLIQMRHKFLTDPNGNLYEINESSINIDSISSNENVLSKLLVDKIAKKWPFFSVIANFYDFRIYFKGGYIQPEEFSTAVLPIMTDFMLALQAYPQQFLHQGAKP